MQDIQVAIITSCKGVWLKFGSTSSLGGGPEVSVADPPVLDDPEFLFERDAG